LLSLPGLLGTAAVTAVGFVWGWLNNKLRPTYGPPVPVSDEFWVTAPVVGTYSPTGPNKVTRGSYSGIRWRKLLTNDPCSTAGNTSQYAPRSVNVGGISKLSISYGQKNACGILNTGFHVHLTAGGTTLMEGLLAGSGNDPGWRTMIFDGWEVEALPGATGIRDARELMPWEGTEKAPEPRQVPIKPAAVEVFPFPIGRPNPFAPLEPVPGAEPVDEPAPPAAVPVVPVVVVRNPVRPALVPQNPVQVQNGVVVRPAPLPVTVTDPDWIFPIPGKPGLPGNGPQPNLPEMAKELGRIERKMEALLNPKGEGNPAPDWLEEFDNIKDQVVDLWDLFTNLAAGGKYVLTEPCDPDGDGVFVKREVEYQGASGPIGVIGNKIDALAELMQAAKDLRQPVCPRPRPQGQLVTARFRSTTPSPNSSRVLRKELRYRDNAGRPEADHVAHWLGFEWQAGPAIVHSKGAAWGIVEVWAADPGEGRRVIRHAAAIAGVDLTVKEHSWVDSSPRSSRYGQPGVMRVEHTQDGIPCISKRDGPSGTPSWMRDP
jgi:hypothetical protein